MKTDKAFKKAFIIGGVYYLIIIAILVINGASNLPYRAGSVLAQLMIASGTIGAIAHYSKKSWGWVTIGLRIILVIILLTIIQVQS